MRTSALRCLGICCGMIGLLAAGCDGSNSGQSRPDGSEAEASSPGETSPPDRDVAMPGTDAVDVEVGRDALSADRPALEPSPDGPSVAPSVDGADVGPAADVPMVGDEDAGPSIGLDGQAGEAGTLPPQDGGLSCGYAGAACENAADCCGMACVSNRCAATCLSDQAACTTSDECCSTLCGAGGTCTPLNPRCKTAGNACATGTQCCSGVCNASHQCAQPGEISYCSQAGDICRADDDCCTGVCNAVPGAAAGICATISSSCQVNGTVCSGCGFCCSHFCGPFGAGDGPHICQPASGCHVQGDLCHQDSDCCGGDVASGLPGAGLVRCMPDPVYGNRIGVCGGPTAGNCPSGVETCKNACNPEGNVCHYKDTAVCEGATTSKRNDCCGCVSGKECCQLDRVGIPRCNALTTCVPSGGNCSFSDECCDGLPCVPDPVTGKLTCGSTCVPLSGLCTSNADCCTGTLCEVEPGSLMGVCIIPPVIAPDGGVVEPDAGVPDASTPPICAYFGQACSPSIDCCDGMSCVNTRFFACSPADPSCFCFSGE